jgi:hypothetical protein
VSYRTTRARAATSNAGQAGIVCLGLTCTPTTGEDAVAAARRWCLDRAVRAETVTDVVRLVEEAVAYGFRFGPRDLVMSMRWADLDRMRIELAWQGCAAQAVAMDGPPGECLQRASRVFDGVAEAWGLGTTEDGESWQWFTVDTRRARPAVTGRSSREGCQGPAR